MDTETQFLLQLCHVLHEEDTPEIPFPEWVHKAIPDLKCTRKPSTYTRICNRLICVKFASIVTFAYINCMHNFYNYIEVNECLEILVHGIVLDGRSQPCKPEA